MTDYPLFTGLIDYGATGEGNTYIFFAARAKSEMAFREAFGKRINKHYAQIDKPVPAYDPRRQPPPYDPKNPVTYTHEENLKRFPDAASWYMVGAEVFQGMPPSSHYVATAMLSDDQRRQLEEQVKSDNSGSRWSAHVDVFLVSYYNFS